MVDLPSARRDVRHTADLVLYAADRDDRLLLNEVLDALRALRALRENLGPIEAHLMELAKDSGLTWEELAALVYGRQYRQWIIRRYRDLGGEKRWAPGRR